MATLSPTSPNSFIAVKAVRDSLNRRNYPHFVQAVVKESDRGVVTFSHLNITTDAVKADEDGYYTPQEWLKLQLQK